MTNIEPVTRRRPGRPVDRIAGVPVSVRRWIGRLALGAAVAVAFLVYAIVRNGFADDATRALAVLGIAALIAPPLILGAFWLALGELVRFPERIQALPLEARDHGEQLRALVERARSPRGTRFGVTRILWQLLRTTRGARDTLTPYAPLLPLVSVPFLAATAAAAFAAAIELLAACIVAVVLLTA
jgi:hypothetical protein